MQDAVESLSRTKTNADKTESLAELLLALLLPHLEVVHHIPGRIRLRIQPSLIEALSENSDALASLIPGLEGCRINPAAATVIIDYQEKCLPPEFWEKLVNHGESGAVLAHLREAWQSGRCDT